MTKRVCWLLIEVARQDADSLQPLEHPVVGLATIILGHPVDQSCGSSYSVFGVELPVASRKPAYGGCTRADKTKCHHQGRLNQDMLKRIRKLAAATISGLPLIAFVLFPSVLMAQNPRGSLLITVQDSSGGRVAGANVSVIQDKFAISRQAKADAQGEARFDSLQPGNYAVTVSAEGFAERTSAVAVAVSGQHSLVITL